MSQFFKRNKIMDERVVNIQNKIYREIYVLISAICMLSAAIKFYLYGVGKGIAYTEIIILVASTIYYFTRSASLGIFSDEVEIHDRNHKTPMSSKNVYLALALGVCASLFFGVRSALVYGEGFLNSLYYFGIVFVAAFAIYLPIFIIIFVIPFILAKKASLKASEKDLIDKE